MIERLQESTLDSRHGGRFRMIYDHPVEPPVVVPSETIAVPEPAAVDTDPLVLTNLARREVPIDIIACEFSPEQLRSWAHDGAEVLRELLTLASVRYHHVPTGHWPQLTKPVELAALIVDIVNEVAASRY